MEKKISPKIPTPKRTIDLTAFGIILISISILINLFDVNSVFLLGLKFWAGLIGAITLIIVESYFLFEKWIIKSIIRTLKKTEEEPTITIRKLQNEEPTIN